MKNIRIPRSICAIIGSSLNGSHATLDALFLSSGAPGDPPNLSHDSKWKEWIFRAGQDENVDSLAFIGNILEEFMDVAPIDKFENSEWITKKHRIINALEEHGFRYFRGGQVIPIVKQENEDNFVPNQENPPETPDSIQKLIDILVKGLPRAIHPLQHRRKGSICLRFDSEYDIQDLLHAMLRPWVRDIRPEEFTPSYAGSSTRMDFLLPDYLFVIETKLIRDKRHGKKVGDELIIDIDHYRSHPKCSELLCVIYDPNRFIVNPSGLVTDLEGRSSTDKGDILTRVIVL